MSSLLSQISHSSSKQTGIRAVVCGVEKIGKTTFACSAPRPLLIPLEVGYSGVSVNHTPMLQTYDEYNALLDEITTACQKGQFQFKTLVTDSATALERLIHEKTIQSDSGWKPGNPKGVTMESALGGYGKAYERANELFGNILKKLDLLSEKGGINIVFTAHAFAGKVTDPTAGQYQCWELLLHSPKNDKTYGKREMLCQWADVVGFLHEPIYINKQDNMTMAISANKGRILGLERTPAYVAGNRYGMKGEISIAKDHSWNYFADYLYKSSGIDVYNRD